MGTSYSGKPTDIGFEEMYGIIKQGVLHPLPAYASVTTATGRLFKAGESLYLMTTAGVQKRNGSSFATFITHTFNNAPTYRDIKPFFEIRSTGTSLTFASATDQSITVTDTMDINLYVNKHVLITKSGVSQCLYITGSDGHTLFTDGLINGTLAK